MFRNDLRLFTPLTAEGLGQWCRLCAYRPERQALSIATVQPVANYWYLCVGTPPDSIVEPFAAERITQADSFSRYFDATNQPYLTKSEWWMFSPGENIHMAINEVIDDTTPFVPLWKEQAAADIDQSRLAKAIARLNATKQRLHRTLISRKGLR